MADDDDCRALRCAGDSWEDKTERFAKCTYYFYLFSPDRGIPHIACPAAHSLAGTPARVPAHVNSHSTSHRQRGPVVHAPGEYLDGAALLGVPPPLDWGGAAASSAAGAGAAFFPCASAASESITLPPRVDRITPSDTAELSS